MFNNDYNDCNKIIVCGRDCEICSEYEICRDNNDDRDCDINHDYDDDESDFEEQFENQQFAQDEYYDHENDLY